MTTTATDSRRDASPSPTLCTSPNRWSDYLTRFVGALTVFISAFLLFQVQPIIGKYILPWFGGTPSVWTTCLLCFQVLLLAGYAYAHGLTRWLTPRRQALVHGGLLLAALVLLPITPSNRWQPLDSQYPTLRILWLLLGTIGLPYFVLSATGPLLQAWLARLQPGRSPYRLYALSNFGSLLALISYPFWFEVHFTRRAQTEWWSWGMAVFILFCGLAAWFVWRHGDQTASAVPTDDGAASPPWTHYLWWLLLPSCAVIVLLATTNKLCEDIAVTPLFWVMPLGLYLLTFIICFDSPRWYSRVLFGAALAPAVAAVVWVLEVGADAPLKHQVAALCGALFVCGMVCHGELYRLKPHPSRLTSYYLLVAAGGALGGMAVALLAPVVFRSYVELHWGLGMCLVLFFLICLRGRSSTSARGWTIFAWLLGVLLIIASERFLSKSSWPYATRGHWLVWLAVPVAAAAGWRWGHAHRWACGLLAILAGTLIFALAKQGQQETRDVLAAIRNFYGVLSVLEYGRGDPHAHYRVLQHGRITHGLQFTHPDRARQPTSYYSTRSGVALALSHLSNPTNRMVGVVGLGVGTLAAYGRAGDEFRFYEINPAVEQLARRQFSYLANSAANVRVVLGDARLVLEREPPQRFDLLALDAFSSDAIPVHLLTREAFEIYLKHMKPQGVIAVHISNRHINLAPVLAGIAEHFHLHYAIINNDTNTSEMFDEDSEGGWWLYESTWVLLSRDDSFFRQPALRDAASRAELPTISTLWTDDYTSLFPLLQ